MKDFPMSDERLSIKRAVKLSNFSTAGGDYSSCSAALGLCEVSALYLSTSAYIDVR